MVAARRFTNAPLAPVAIASAVGMLIGLRAAPHPWPLVGLAGVCAGLAWRGRRRSRRAVPALLVLWGCLGILRVWLWQAHPTMTLGGLLPEEPRQVALHGVVRDELRLRRATEASPGMGEPRPRGPKGDVYTVDVKDLRAGGGWRPVRGRVRATIRAARIPLAAGDEVLLEGRWARVPSPGTPGQYDWRAALHRQRVLGVIDVKPFDGLVRLRQGQGRPWRQVLAPVRRRWERMIQRIFPPRDAGVLASLLLGQRSAIEARLHEAFVRTGTVHLLVISGFHVGFVAALLALGLRLAGVAWRPRLLVIAMGLGAYCLLVGPRPPVVRATVMAWMVLAALALDRTICWSNLLAAAALLLLWANPAQLLDPGFQLSFGAVASLLLFAGRWRRGVERTLWWVKPRWVRRYVALSGSATAAVWVGLWPVLARYFYLLVPVAIPANILVTPLIGLLVMVGMAGLLAGLVAEPVLHWVAPVLSGLVGAVDVCVTWCRKLPWGSWSVGRPAWWVLASYYGLLALTLQRRRSWSRGRLAGCWLLAITVWLWVSVAVRAVESRWLTVDVLDVGHGDSIVIRTPGGHTLLVDAGTLEAGRRRVVPFLRREGIRTLDALILTHLDDDHIGGAVPVMEALRVRRLLTNGAWDDTMAFHLLEETAQRFGVPWGRLRAGMSIGGDPAVEIQVLHPPMGEVVGLAPGSNEHSVVMKLTKGDVSVLFTGDLEEAGLPWLLAQQDVLASTVLKVPHHGSALGPAGKAFFASVDPEFAIISVGWTHHLPASATVEALERLGARVMLTRRDGAIRVRTDGQQIDITTGRGRRWTR